MTFFIVRGFAEVHIYILYIRSMRVYIVFVFSLDVCVVVCVNIFFSVKDFSETTKFRILKFIINVGNDKFYCVKENQPPPAYLSLFVNFSFSPIKFSDFLAPMRHRVFKLCIRIECGQVYCGKEKQDAEIYFCFLFTFFHLSLQCNIKGNLRTVSRIWKLHNLEKVDRQRS